MTSPTVSYVYFSVCLTKFYAAVEIQNSSSPTKTHFFTDEIDPIWYQMNLYIIGWKTEQNTLHNDLFEACFIREVSGTNLQDNDDDPFSYPREEKLNLTDRAMVGLNVNDVDWLQSFDPKESIPRQELEKMFFRLKIYACHDSDDALYVGE